MVCWESVVSGSQNTEKVIYKYMRVMSLSSLHTQATTGPNTPAPVDRWQVGSSWRVRSGKGNGSTGKIPHFVPTNTTLPDLESNPVCLSKRVDCGTALFPIALQLIDGEHEGISGMQTCRLQPRSFWSTVFTGFRTTGELQHNAVRV
jgi:hypothetical protein